MPLSSRLLLLPLGLAFAAPLHAQRDTSASVCLGFAFGPWTPALDWRRAGHGAAPDTSRLARAAENRDWAATGVVAAEDSALFLYPRWWPAGVMVTLPTRTPAPGDTVTGQARALVADGRQANPTSKVRAWAVKCG